MKKEGKNLKIFGFRSDLCGDAIMAIPVLTYFEKLYSNSYKIFHLLGKCGQMVELFINHPLIDKIKVSKNIESYDEEDYEIMKSCDIVINTRPNHDSLDWFNKFDCVTETARMAGINEKDFNSTLTYNEKFPKLHKWFNIGEFDPNSVGYCRKENVKQQRRNNVISIKPFAGYNRVGKRSCNEEWWKGMVKELLNLGYEVEHFGYVTESWLSDDIKYKKLTYLSFFDQIKICLDSFLTIGDDSGFMWCLGGYSHKSIHLLSNWQPGHITNFLSFAPKNINSINIFKKDNINLISYEEVIESIKILSYND